MRETIDTSKEFDKLLKALDLKDEITVSEFATYHGFFINGWFGRTGVARYQDLKLSEKDFIEIVNYANKIDNILKNYLVGD